jgi:hypothetical protein
MKKTLRVFLVSPAILAISSGLVNARIRSFADHATGGFDFTYGGEQSVMHQHEIDTSLAFISNLRFKREVTSMTSVGPWQSGAVTLRTEIPALDRS